MKKLFIIFLLAGLWIFTANAQQWVNFSSSAPKAPELNLITSNAQGVTFTVTIPGIYTQDTVVNSIVFKRLILPGGDAINLAGAPELPVLTYRVAIPNCDATNVIYRIDSKQTMPSCRVYPMPEIVLDGNGMFVEQFALNAASYAQPRIIEPAAVILSKGAFRAQRYVEVTVQPIEFCPVTQQLSVIDKIEVTLNFTNPQGELRQNVGIFNKVATASFINYEDDGISASINDKAYKREGFTPGNVNWITLTDTAQACTIPGDYLIITVPEFFNENDPNSQLKRLAEHRAHYNAFDVSIVNVENILSLPFYFEEQDEHSGPYEYIKEQKMRTFIRRVFEGKNAHNSHNPYSDGSLAYVLLVGDNYEGNTGMPASYDDSYDSLNYNMGYPSDYYYTAITKTGSTYDELGSLFIGRMSVEDTIHLYNMVQKTIYHETEHYNPEPWRKSAGITLGDWFFGNPYRTDYINFISELLEEKEWDYTIISGEPIREPTLNYLNNGVVFAEYIGGPNPAYPSGWEDNLIEDTLALRLHNDFNAPFTFTLRCHTAHFDNYDCFGEYITRYSPTKGAVGYIGSSRSGYIGANNTIDTTNLRVLQEIFPYYLLRKNVSITGELLLIAKNLRATGVLYNNFERHGYTLLGDPALNILAVEYDGCSRTISNQTQVVSGDTLTIPDDCSLFFLPQGKLIIEEGGSLVLGNRVQIIGVSEETNAIIHVKGGGFTVGNNVTFKNIGGGILLDNYNYDATKQYNLANVDFSNTPLTHRNTSLNISNCYFYLSNVKTSVSIFKIENCTFSYSTFTSEYPLLQDSKRKILTTVGNCNFTGWSSIVFEMAIKLHNSNALNIYNNTIKGYHTGISLTGSGTSTSFIYSPETISSISGNKISNCSSGIALFNSVANLQGNNIYNNYHGVCLYNNSSTSFGTLTPHQPYQVIKDCESIELYASANSFPAIFIYNQIIDEDNGGNSVSDPLVYWDITYGPFGMPAKRNVNFNNWGINFNRLDDLYPPELFICDSIWYPLMIGSPIRGAEETLLQTGLSYFANEDYANAETTFKEVIETYPESRFAIAAMHELFALEQFLGNDFYKLHNYYTSFTSSDSNLFNTAEFLATRCHVKERNWQPAIDWYENRIENPPSYQDSVFAVIDLGDIHLMMEADTLNGAKSGSIFRYRLTNVKPRSKREYETSKANLLATLPQIKKPQTDKLQNPNLFTDKKGALGQCIPNPATGNATITYEMYSEGSAEIRIYNIAGQLLQALPQGTLVEGSYQTKISLAGIPAGMYHYTLFVNGERTDAKKLIVN